MLLSLRSSVSSFFRIGVVTLVLLALRGLSGSVSAQSVSPTCNGIQLGAFDKPVVTTVALREGFFAQEGLNVCYNQVTSSVSQFNDLFAGKYQLILTAADNVVNRIVNSKLPVEIVAGSDTGPDIVLAVNTSLGINSIADLRGKPIAVDAPDSGYVFALRKILADNGLFLEKGDYSLQVIGGTPLRYQYLAAGQTPTGDPVYGTLLTYPYTVISASQASISVLARFSDYVAPYQARVLATTTDYAVTSPDTIIAFLRAYIKAGQFVANPANRAVVIADIAADLGVTSNVAATELDADLSHKSGEILNAQIDEQGLINTINLRQEFGGFNNPVDSIELAKAGSSVYNDQYWQAAINSLSRKKGRGHKARIQYFELLRP
ncbi:MAG: ABC transporter substrate-binding protein [Stigonema ocellatum SAG 48.90 = DSM 106950]|nr:ABC transporter substrate-binding protein [Stigonema ocellatum SAG 48.90 = DSM 106950]